MHMMSATTMPIKCVTYAFLFFHALIYFSIDAFYSLHSQCLFIGHIMDV